MVVSSQIILALLFISLLSSVLSLSLRTGTIYKLLCQVTGKIYIGRTTVEISEAMRLNKSMFERYKLGTFKSFVGFFEVMANKDYNVTILEIIHELANDTDLMKRQRYYIEQYDNTVNKIRPSRTKKEYRAVNRDHYLQLYKKYREENKEAIHQKAREQYPRVRSLRLAKLTCDVCGIKISKAALSKHNKSTRHLTALAKLNTGSESGTQYEQHLNELLNAQKEICDVCGKQYAKASLWHHKLTKRHRTALAKLGLNTVSSSAAL